MKSARRSCIRSGRFPSKAEKLGRKLLGLGRDVAGHDPVSVFERLSALPSEVREEIMPALAAVLDGAEEVARRGRRQDSK